MKLINKYANSRYSKMNEYYCGITTELDKLAGIDPNGHWKHYVLCDYEDGCLPIRIPGGTLGTIEYDENKIITKIHVCTDYVVKTYPDDVNEQLQKFIGQKIEMEELVTFQIYVIVMNVESVGSLSQQFSIQMVQAITYQIIL